jgi:syntaxin 1B/2/3
MQEPLVNSAEQHTENVLQNTERANNKLTTAVGSSRRARKLRWVCCIIALVLLIAIAIAIILVGKFVFHWF